MVFCKIKDEVPQKTQGAETGASYKLSFIIALTRRHIVFHITHLSICGINRHAAATAARQQEAARLRLADPSTMVAETSDSMPTASITTCCHSSCCLYLSRCNITRASQQMGRNAVLWRSHMTKTKSRLATMKVPLSYFWGDHGSLMLR